MFFSSIIFTSARSATARKSGNNAITVLQQALGNALINAKKNQSE
jgi:hypothetical protein